MQDLRANTQVIVTIGPFVDVSDGFTPETGIALSTADEAELMKHGSSTVVDISGATWAAVTGMDGYYSLTLTTSYTDTEGQLTIAVNDDSVCLPVIARFRVLSEAAYDSLYAAKDDGFMDVNVKTIGRADTQETEADNLESACANYSATRGLTGTALPAAAADAAGGLPISDAGGLDLDGRTLSATAVTNANTVFDTDFATNYNATRNAWATNVQDTVGTGNLPAQLGDTSHGGTSATLRLGGSSSTPAFYVTNSGGDAVQFESTATGEGSASHGLHLIGSSDLGGDGLRAEGSTSDIGHGIHAIGGGTGGNGIYGVTTVTAGTNAGIYGRGASTASGIGIFAVGGSSGSDINGDITGNLTGSVGSVTAIVTANATQIDGNATAAANLKNMSLATATGTVQADGSNTATTFKIDSTLGAKAADYFGDSNGGAALVFVDGTTNEWQARRITGFNTATDFVTVDSAFDAAPSTSDAFVILGRIET